MFLIGDHNWQQHVEAVVDGQTTKRGLIPRDYSVQPVGSIDGIVSFGSRIQTIPRSEWSERCRDKVKYKSRLSDIRNTGNNGQKIPSLDQNGQGYCWAYSSTACVMLARAAMGQPYVRLSAHSVACVIKGFRDEGGWGAHSAEYIQKKGVAPVSHWPEKSMSRSHNTEATWQEALKYRIAEGWMDLEVAAYNRRLTFEQTATGLLLNMPGVGDFNWWGHSVALMDLVDGRPNRYLTRSESGKLATLAEFELMWGFNTESDGFGIGILNSWTDGWGESGTSTLTGSKATPNGGVVIETVLAA